MTIPWPLIRRDISHAIALAAVCCITGVCILASPLWARADLANFPEAGLNDVASPREGTRIVDARAQSKYAAGHIPGAVSLPLDDFETAFSQVSERLSGSRIIVYCSSYDCKDSLILAGKLRERGWSELLVFRAGWEEWEAAGLPTEQ